MAAKGVALPFVSMVEQNAVFNGRVQNNMQALGTDHFDQTTDSLGAMTKETV